MSIRSMKPAHTARESGHSGAQAILATSPAHRTLYQSHGGGVASTTSKTTVTAKKAPKNQIYPPYIYTEHTTTHTTTGGTF